MTHLLPMRIPEYHDLPGPDVATKRRALEYAHTDDRMMKCLIAAVQTGWPRGYHCDLYEYDMRWLKDNPGVACIMILRPLGTRLYPVVSDNKHAAEYVRKAIRYDSGVGPLNYIPDGQERPRFFHITAGGELTELGWRGALDLVQYAEAVLS